jgi:CheY-like chemotaxis protein
MKILLAEDDLVSSAMLQSDLQDWGYTPIAVTNGADAWQVLQERTPPELALIDWMMPTITGPELCRFARELGRAVPTHLILLTGRATKEDIVQGLQAGAHDYITKPFDSCELRARIDVGRRMVEVQSLLAKRVAELEDARHHIKQLHGLLPMCCRCKKVRDDSGYWNAVEAYIERQVGGQITHGFCPECHQSALAEIKRGRNGAAVEREEHSAK